MRNSAGYYSTNSIKMVNSTHATFEKTYKIIFDFLVILQDYKNDNLIYRSESFRDLFGNNLSEEEIDCVYKLLSNYKWNETK